jgi:pimeloyl-ACP methyl ester carboxylesterase
MPLVRIGSGDVNYTSHGEGHSIIALHAGLGSGLGDFRRFIPRIPEGLRLVLPDRIGYGKSTHIETFSEPFFQKQVDDVIEVMDALDIGKAGFWGWSDGTVVALNLAIRHPERVSAIVAEAGHYCPIPETDTLFRRFLSPDELTKRERESFSKQHGDPYWRKLLRIWSERWLEFNQTKGDFYDGRLGEVQCPVIFLIGDSDEHVQVWEFEKMHELVGGSELVVFEGAGHAAHLGGNETAFSRAMFRFLEEHL